MGSGQEGNHCLDTAGLFISTNTPDSCSVQYTTFMMVKLHASQVMAWTQEIKGI
jgi:hypothetical protein